MVDNDDGVVLDHSVEQGNPPDAPQLVPAVARVKKRAGIPGTVTADRGYCEAKVDQQPDHLGVTTVVIPRRGRPSPARRAEEHPKSLPPHREMAHRGRRPHQLSQTRIWLGSDPHRRPRRHPDLDRTRDPRPQPGQDQRPRRMTAHPEARRSPGPASPKAATRVRSSTVTLQVEVVKLVKLTMLLNSRASRRVHKSTRATWTTSRSTSQHRTVQKS
jgi:IS5 family transposase